MKKENRKWAQPTKRQKQAIKNVELALRKLRSSGVYIAGMDNKLLWSTKNAIDWWEEENGGEEAHELPFAASPHAFADYPLLTGHFKAKKVYTGSGGF